MVGCAARRWDLTENSRANQRVDEADRPGIGEQPGEDEPLAGIGHRVRGQPAQRRDPSRLGVRLQHRHRSRGGYRVLAEPRQAGENRPRCPGCGDLGQPLGVAPLVVDLLEIERSQ